MELEKVGFDARLFRNKIIEAAEDLLATMLEHGLTQEPDRKAVFLTVWKKGEPIYYFKTKIGTTFPTGDFGKGCCEFSEEKLRRAFEFGHISSWPSRDLLLKRYGGAVVLEIEGEEWGFSVSGLKEWEDEAMALIIGSSIYAPFKAPVRVSEILAISGNAEYVKKLVEAGISKR